MAKMTVSVLAGPALAVLALVGCESKAPEPAPSPKPPAATPEKPMPTGAAAATGATKPSAAQAEAVTWTKPDAWEKVDHPSPMRKATFKIKRAEGDPEDGEMSIITAGGSVDANIGRWEGQFGGNKAKIEKKDNNGLKVTVVEITGDFAGGGPMMGGGGEPKKDWVMLAAIAEASTLYFFKLTGPKKTIEAARPDFDKFVGSISGK